MQRVAKDGPECDHQHHRRVKHAVDRALERRAWVAECPCLAGDTCRKAVLPDGGDAVAAGSLDDERARPYVLAGAPGGGLGLPGQDRFVEPEVPGAEQRAVGHELIPRRQPHHVVEHHLIGRNFARNALALDRRAGGDQQR